jgi:hypothetical protein
VVELFGRKQLKYVSVGGWMESQLVRGMGVD